MKKLPLSGGKAYALVDDEDYDVLMKFKWCLTAKGYAMTGVRMHRLVMDAPDGMEVDHKNGDRLDNRKENLRICTAAQNSQSKKLYKGARSGFKGVLRRSHGPEAYVARITKNYHSVEMGGFKDPHHAAMVYDILALDLFGDFAMTNFKPVIHG